MIETKISYEELKETVINLGISIDKQFGGNIKENVEYVVIGEWKNRYFFFRRFTEHNNSFRPMILLYKKNTVPSSFIILLPYFFTYLALLMLFYVLIKFGFHPMVGLFFLGLCIINVILFIAERRILQRKLEELRLRRKNWSPPLS